MSGGTVITVSLPGPGARVAGKYRIERIVGRGGMGVVYSAYHEVLDHRVALKILAPETASQATAVARFLNEARLAARLKSDHLCQVLDAGVTEHGLPFIAMELLEGCDLSKLLHDRRQPLPVGEAVEYVMQALDAVAEAHARGVVHRDLKPSNLFLTHTSGGQPMIKVLDFGISKVDDAFGAGGMPAGNITSSRAIIGSPTYMSPEQIQNVRKTDHRTDIWSAGVILYELLSGTLPFRGETPGEIFVRIIEGQLVSLSQVRKDVPKALSDIVTRCLKRNVDERFDSVVSLAEALAPFAWFPHPDSLARMRRAIGGRVRSGEHAPPGTTSGATVPAGAQSGMTTARGERDDAGKKVLLALAAVVPLVIIPLVGVIVVHRMGAGGHAENAPTEAASVNVPVAETATATATAAATAAATATATATAAATGTATATETATASATAAVNVYDLPVAPSESATATAPATTAPAWTAPASHPGPSPKPGAVPTSKRSILQQRN